MLATALAAGTGFKLGFNRYMTKVGADDQDGFT